MRAIIALLAVALTTTSICGQTQSAQSKKVASNPQIAEINEAMQKFVDARAASGIVTLVAQHGKIIHFGAVGLADIEKQREMKPFSLFAIASMTKPIVASAVMALQDEDKLHVNDPVSKYLPAFRNARLESGDAPTREITIRDCVTHTAGLNGQQIFKGSLENAVNELANRPLAFPPGEKWSYSPGLNVAGRIVEIVSGQSLDKFLEERFFKPLKMNNTTFFPNAKQIRRVATLYGPGENHNTLAPTTGFLGDLAAIEAPNPSGGLISHGRDLFKFYQMVLNGGRFRGQRLLSKQAVAEMTSPQTGDLQTGFTPGNCWGLGWCIVREPQGVTESIGSGTFGHGGAFGTQGWVDPKTKAVYVLLLQRTRMGNSDGSEIRKSFHDVASRHLQ